MEPQLSPLHPLSKGFQLSQLITFSSIVELSKKIQNILEELAFEKVDY
jgi:hypothetical protein